MDKREIRSRKAIIEGFSKALTKYGYEKMSVQNILDEAGISRSAFYALSSQLAGIPVSTLTLHAELIRRESVGPPPIQEYRTAHLTADVEES